MNKCNECGSYAINRHCHGRDGSDPDLCDVCYWRKRATHPDSAEQVEVSGWQWLDTGHYRKTLPKNAHNPRDWNPLMTVAQHQRIMAALADNSGKPNLSAGCKVVPMDLIERTICRLTHGHEHDKAVRELRAILEAKQ